MYDEKLVWFFNDLTLKENLVICSKVITFNQVTLEEKVHEASMVHSEQQVPSVQKGELGLQGQQEKEVY